MFLNNAYVDYLFPKLVYGAENILRPEYLEEIGNACREIVRTEGAAVLPHFNVESTHTLNSRLCDEPEFAEFNEIILTYIKDFLQRMNYPQYILDNIRILNMWTNISGENSFVFPHLHPGSYISGAFYVEAPEGSRIGFYDDHKNFFLPQDRNEMTETYRTYPCIKNNLYLFRSDLLHGLVPQPAGERIVISFNTYIKESVKESN
jgi:uncharacterized protein (TIGR02466 family)